ncbi:MAG: UDP-3-O-(3-hydroxymyristoyl)glucosamine N-acyltransferase [Flavobacteriaceae bacterium]|nr:UDP-3-O-(3-hydroxymyristoyl)glucosamine N-acyltransferase [Flavobacteriaceae bacterium]
MKFTATQISEILEGEIEGDPTIEVFELSKIEEGKAGSLTFLSNPKYTPFLYQTNASIAIVNKTFIPEKKIKATLIKVEDPYGAFSKLLSFYDQVKLNKVGVKKSNFVHKSAKIGKNVYIAQFAYIGKNVKIGDNVKLFPNTFVGDNVKIGNDTVLFSGSKVYHDSVIGNNCIIHSGAIIGSDGFGFAPNGIGSYDKIPQIGNVVLGNNVDVGANTTIDRATLGTTIIANGVKLDNQIQIAHNVEIDENTVIAAQTGIAGSTKIGRNCQIGGQVGIAGHLTIGDYVKIQAQSGIGKNLKDHVKVQGSPAFSYSGFFKSYVHFKNLTKLADRVHLLEKELKKIKKD